MSSGQTEPSADQATASLNVTHHGPYRLDGAAELVDHLGVAIAFDGLALLCRCGHSKTKPFCDGSP